MSIIQDIIDRARTKEIVLPQDEYKGPLVITKPCIIDGGDSILWATRGPVLLIDSPNVIVRNLSVEVVGSQRNLGLGKAAIQTNYPTAKLANVSVIGEVKGFSNDPDWNLPEKFDLGLMNANEVLEFDFNVKTHTKVSVESETEGIHVSPSVIEGGILTALKIRITERHAGEYIFGNVSFKSAGVTRKVPITGQIKAQPTAGFGGTPTSSTSAPTRPITSSAPASVRELRRGERVTLTGFDKSNITVKCENSGKPSGLDIDTAFVLVQKNGKVRTERDFVFFNNLKSADASVKFDGESTASIDLNRVSPLVEKIIVASAVSSESGYTLGQVKSPTVRITDTKGNCMVFSPEFTKEKSVIYAEFYRYNADWKVGVVGMGHGKGLEFLCSLYGIATE